jgi:rhodanese-related sulfurtransferase
MAHRSGIRSNRKPHMVEHVSVREVWTRLQQQPEAQLCDVRTDLEWREVGVPDLSTAGKQPLFISWQQAPMMQLNAHFIQQLDAAGLDRDAPLYFICRSGARSQAAAEAAQAAGYRSVYNVAEGFEGRPGAYAGWSAQGLPSKRPE